MPNILRGSFAEVEARPEENEPAKKLVHKGKGKKVTVATEDTGN